MSIALAIPHLTSLTLIGMDCPCGHKEYPVPPIEERHIKTAFEAQQDRYAVHVPEMRAYRGLADILKIKTLTQLRLRNIFLFDSRWKTVKPSCRIRKLEIGYCLPAKYHPNQGAANRIMELFETDIEELTLEALPTQREVPLTRPRKIPLVHLHKLHLDALMPAQDRKHTLYYLSGSPIRKLTISCLKSDIQNIRQVLREFHQSYPAAYPQLEKITFRVVEMIGLRKVVRTPFPICVARRAKADGRSLWRQLDGVLAGLSFGRAGAWCLQGPMATSHSYEPGYEYASAYAIHDGPNSLVEGKEKGSILS